MTPSIRTFTRDILMLTAPSLTILLLWWFTWRHVEPQGLERGLQGAMEQGLGGARFIRIMHMGQCNMGMEGSR